jgi:tetratricopeptide (TPR) repeat protein
MHLTTLLTLSNWQTWRSMALVILLLPSVASARSPKGVKDAEMALLPKYCPYTQGGKLGSTVDKPSAAVNAWVNAMGPDFWHMHHHCWALIHFNRAQRANLPLSTKRAFLTEARDDFLYIVEVATPTFIHLPEAYVWLGRTTLQLGNIEEGIGAYKSAVELKPDYWPAYYHWATFLKGRDARAQALEVARQGLAASSQAKPLELLYRDLGGDPSLVRRQPQSAADSLPGDGPSK